MYESHVALGRIKKSPCTGFHAKRSKESVAKYESFFGQRVAFRGGFS